MIAQTPGATPDKSSAENHTVEQAHPEMVEGTPATGMPDNANMETPFTVNQFMRGGSPFITIMLTPGVEISEWGFYEVVLYHYCTFFIFGIF